RSRQHGQRIRGAGGAQVGAFERIHRDVDLGQTHDALGSATDALADEQHRRLVAFAFANDNRPVDPYIVERLAHRLDGRAVGTLAIALPHRVRTGDGRLFDDA